jgi:hypothetical protein
MIREANPVAIRQNRSLLGIGHEQILDRHFAPS